MDVEFINHAAIKITTPDAVILTDPWFTGAAFHAGWKLVFESDDMMERALDGTTHIWISHEHPDHFVPGFFKAVPDHHRERITVLFQKTKDRRVVGFLEKAGFKVQEIPAEAPVNIGGRTTIKVGPVSFYDSWLFVDDGTHTLLNINDCPLRDAESLRAVRRKLGRIDVLLTQFGYAAWKGGRDHGAFRREAAREKLDHVALQANELQAGHVIPFASFIWFAHRDNAFLNDGANTTDDVVARQGEYEADLVVMKPYQRWTVGSGWDNTPALDFWREQFATVAGRQPIEPTTSHNLQALQDTFDAYRKRMYAQNSGLFIWLARHNPVMKAFQPLRIHLTDLDRVVSVSLVDGFHEVEGTDFDVQMHSESLWFIFKMDFGYDTLTVNGRFEATPEGFSKMTRSFALGSLNAMGMKMGPGLLLRADLVFELLSLLGKVRKKLASGSNRSAEAA